MEAVEGVEVEGRGRRGGGRRRSRGGKVIRAWMEGKAAVGGTVPDISAPGELGVEGGRDGREARQYSA